MAIDYSTDYLIWDDVETITYFSKVGEAVPATGTTVTHTLWMSIRKSRLTADSLLAKMDLTVNIPGATLGTIVPKVGDVLRRSNGTRWIVGVVEVIVVGNEYRVHVSRSFKNG